MKENVARIFTIILLLGGGLSIGFAWWLGQANTITLHAHTPETGGWTPADLTVAASQPLHLRLTSDDVMHGFAIGQSDQPAVDVKPGEMTDYTVMFDKPGIYTFYCTRWCGPNHWRMRGTIMVTGETADQPVAPPLYVQLGLNIDATHEAQVIPIEKPSAERIANLVLDLSDFQAQDYYRSHSPEQIWQELREAPNFASYSDQILWDAVAFVWQSNITSKTMNEAKQLYAENCAACHGESGNGDGVYSGQQVQGQNEADKPTDFTDPRLMLSASPALLQGKLIRGGMGTGMPMWGVIFTDEQTWALANYLYTFQFEEVP